MSIADGFGDPVDNRAGEETVDEGMSMAATIIVVARDAQQLPGTWGIGRFAEQRSANIHLKL